MSVAAPRDQSLDALRGIAILMVVLYHFNSRLPGYALNAVSGMPLPFSFGWVGVYFFFIISGYCIFLTLERSSSIGVFWAKRFSRIYPAYVAAIVLLLVFHAVFAVPSVPEAAYHERDAGWRDVLLNLVFLGEIGEWVNGSFWSIAAEVKFYALIGIMALLFRDPATLARRFAQLSLVGAVVWVAAVPFSPRENDPFTIQSMLKFLAIAPYLSAFAIGILAQQRHAEPGRYGLLLGANLVLATLVIWVQAVRYEDADLLSAGAAALAFLVLTLLLLRLASPAGLPIIPVVTPLLARIGLVSYSWYLLHEIMGLSFIATLNRVFPPAVSLVLAILGTLCVAIVFSAACEWRFRKPVERAVLWLMGPWGRGRSPDPVNR